MTSDKATRPNVSRPLLANVTLCAASSVQMELTARALAISASQCEFGDAILFSDTPMQGAFRNVRIDRLTSQAAYSAFMLKGMAPHLRTPLVLVTQWDGYVV